MDPERFVARDKTGLIADDRGGSRIPARGAGGAGAELAAQGPGLRDEGLRGVAGAICRHRRAGPQRTPARPLAAASTRASGASQVSIRRLSAVSHQLTALALSRLTGALWAHDSSGRLAVLPSRRSNDQATAEAGSQPPVPANEAARAVTEAPSDYRAPRLNRAEDLAVRGRRGAQAGVDDDRRRVDSPASDEVRMARLLSA